MVFGLRGRRLGCVIEETLGLSTMIYFPYSFGLLNYANSVGGQATTSMESSRRLPLLFLSTFAVSQLVAAIKAEVTSQITAPARLVARQNTGISALWLLSSTSDSSKCERQRPNRQKLLLLAISNVLVDEPTWCPLGSTITSSASFWRCCTTSGECPWYTTCFGSTAVGPDARETW
jgi:hypothetical protein